MLRREQQRRQGIVAVVQRGDVGAHNAVRREGGRDKRAAGLGQVCGVQDASLDHSALYLIRAREGAAEAPALRQRGLEQRPRLRQCELRQWRALLAVVLEERRPLASVHAPGAVEVLQPVAAPIQQEHQRLQVAVRQPPAQDEDLLAALASLLHPTGVEALLAWWRGGDTTLGQRLQGAARLPPRLRGRRGGGRQQLGQRRRVRPLVVAPLLGQKGQQVRVQGRDLLDQPRVLRAIWPRLGERQQLVELREPRGRHVLHRPAFLALRLGADEGDDEVDDPDQQDRP